jgi:hypothetical protein
MVEGHKDFEGKPVDFRHSASERVHGMVSIPERQRPFHEGFGNVSGKQLEERSARETVLRAEGVDRTPCQGSVGLPGAALGDKLSKLFFHCVRPESNHSTAYGGRALTWSKHMADAMMQVGLNERSRPISKCAIVKIEVQPKTKLRAARDEF